MTVTDSLDPNLSLDRWERETYLVERLLVRYARVLDSGSIAAWPDLFVDSGTYSLTTQENLRGAGMSLFVDRGREALNERAAYAHGYWLTPQRKTLHVITNVAVDSVDDGVITSHAYLVLYRVNRRGESVFHVSAEYNDLIELTDSGPRFASHQVVLDGSTMPADMSAIL
jgi:3-phenylpropionate/cinnamic acid dioxygenase small subunit